MFEPIFSLFFVKELQHPKCSQVILFIVDKKKIMNFKEGLQDDQRKWLINKMEIETYYKLEKHKKKTNFNCN